MFQPLETPKDATYPEWEAIEARGYTLVKCGSHRAREKLTRLLGYTPQGYYSFYARNHVYEVHDSRLDEAVTIKGVTKSRRIYGISRTW